MRKQPVGGPGTIRVSQTAPEQKSLSHAVWDTLESTPGFNEGLREAEADLAAGRGVRYELKGRALRRVQPARRDGED